MEPTSCVRSSGTLVAPLRAAAIALMFASGFLAAATGCSTRSRLAADSKAPADFSLSLTVDEMAPGGSAWYVLDADGTLRIATGARRADSPVPPVARQLSPDQVEQVWNQVRSSGLEQAVWDSPQCSESLIQAQGGIVFLAGGRARRAAAFASGDERVAATVTTLRSLAWIEQSAIPRP
ncbi:MAG: hypothetical protein NTV94_18230 [Planctomycetota bacterium]|nr:hypothetical protein [Planctomycetota bacterium]